MIMRITIFRFNQRPWITYESSSVIQGLYFFMEVSMERIFKKLDRYFGFWKIGVLNPDNGLWSLTPSSNKIGYLRAMNTRGYHIFMKPEDERRFLLLDDIPEDRLNYQKEQDRFKPGRLVVETSPGNFQVWVKAGRSISNPEKRYWIRYFNSDTACDPNSRWGRCPGFRNRKDKYEQDGHYPLSRLIWVDWQKVAQIPKITLPKKPVCLQIAKVCVKKHNRSGKYVQRCDYERGDDSTTDFAYVLALLRQGVDPEAITERLLHEREDWTHHKGERRQTAYLKRTIRKAVDIIND